MAQFLGIHRAQLHLTPKWGLVRVVERDQFYLLRIQINKSQLRELTTANHILHYRNVVDAYGHISLRHLDNPEIFIMSGDKAPALASSPSDLIQ
jgi:hypothetical protein